MGNPTPPQNPPPRRRRKLPPPKPRAGSPARPPPPRRQVLPPTDVVDYTVFDRVEKKAVDRKIPALRVLLGRREPHRVGPAAVGVGAVGPERRHLYLGAPVAHEDHAERLADRLRVG